MFRTYQKGGEGRTVTTRELGKDMFLRKKTRPAQSQGATSSFIPQLRRCMHEIHTTQYKEEGYWGNNTVPKKADNDRRPIELPISSFFE